MAGISIVRRTKVLALLAGVAAAINIGLNFVLIPPFGMVGAAVATAAATRCSRPSYRVAQRYYRDAIRAAEGADGARPRLAASGSSAWFRSGPLASRSLVKAVVCSAGIVGSSASSTSSTRPTDVARHASSWGAPPGRGACREREPPLVSVIMASYNGEALIARDRERPRPDLLQRRARGRRRRLERRHAEIVRLVRRAEPGYACSRSTSGSGPCAPPNDAIDRSEGPLLAWLDHDDLWLPEKTRASRSPCSSSVPKSGSSTRGYEAFDSEDRRSSRRGATESARERGRRARADLFVKGCFVASLTAALPARGC